MHTEKETSTFTKKRHFRIVQNVNLQWKPSILPRIERKEPENDQTDGNQAEVIPKVKYSRVRVKKRKVKKI
jgi:hypothetical protein